MSHNLGTEKVNRLLWQLSVPAMLGMLSSAIFNIVDRIFVEKVSEYALTGVGITMPIQVLQMAFVLLIGIGTSSLISIKLGEGKKEEAEDILYLALKYIVLFLSIVILSSKRASFKIACSVWQGISICENLYHNHYRWFNHWNSRILS